MHQRALHPRKAWLELPEDRRADREISEGVASLGNEAEKAAPGPDWQRLRTVSDYTGIHTECHM